MGILNLIYKEYFWIFLFHINQFLYELFYEKFSYLVQAIKSLGKLIILWLQLVRYNFKEYKIDLKNNDGKIKIEIWCS